MRSATWEKLLLWRVKSAEMQDSGTTATTVWLWASHNDVKIVNQAVQLCGARPAYCVCLDYYLPLRRRINCMSGAPDPVLERIQQTSIDVQQCVIRMNQFHGLLGLGIVREGKKQLRGLGAEVERVIIQLVLAIIKARKSIAQKKSVFRRVCKGRPRYGKFFAASQHELALKVTTEVLLELEAEAIVVSGSLIQGSIKDVRDLRSCASYISRFARAIREGWPEICENFYTIIRSPVDPEKLLVSLHTELAAVERHRSMANQNPRQGTGKNTNNPPGRPQSNQSQRLAEFARKRRSGKKPLSWNTITNEWNTKHSDNRVTQEQMRGAYRTVHGDRAKLRR
jgi:hypothetical protein